MLSICTAGISLRSRLTRSKSRAVSSCAFPKGHGHENELPLSVCGKKIFAQERPRTNAPRQSPRKRRNEDAPPEDDPCSVNGTVRAALKNLLKPSLKAREDPFRCRPVLLGAQQIHSQRMAPACGLAVTGSIANTTASASGTKRNRATPLRRNMAGDNARYKVSRQCGTDICDALRQWPRAVRSPAPEMLNVSMVTVASSTKSHRQAPGRQASLCLMVSPIRPRIMIR